jgi:hypothetical protein
MTAAGPVIMTARKRTALAPRIASRIPFGFLVVGGLFFSRVAALFMTPGLCLYMRTFRGKAFGGFEFALAGSSRGEEACPSFRIPMTGSSR